MPDCGQPFRDTALCVLNVDVTRHDRRMADELSAEQGIHVPFPDRRGPGRKKFAGSPPAPWMPRNDPPASTHVLKAARCSSLSVSPLVLFHTTSLNFESWSGFITAPFSVTKYGHPRCL